MTTMPILDDGHAGFERFWPTFLTIGSEWGDDGPRSHRERIQRYRRNEKIYRGDHSVIMKDAWDRLLRSRGFSWEEIRQLQVTIPLCTQVSDFPADMLFSEQPLMQVSGLGGDQATFAKRWLEDLERLNSLQRTFYKGATSQSYRGDALLKVRHEGTGGRAVIEAQPAEHWFPWANPNNVAEVWAHVIAWRRELSVSAETAMVVPWWVRLLAFLGLAQNVRSITVLRAEVHFKGLVVNRMYLLEGGRIKRELPLDLLPEYDPETLREYDDTGVPEFLIRHIPNFELDNQLEGIDDYGKLIDLQKEINIRATQTGRVLDKNQAPTFYGPPIQGEFDPDTGRYQVSRSMDGSYISVDSEFSLAPGAITWDGHETAAKDHLEQMVDYFWVAAGLNKAPWAGDSAGGQEAAAAIQRRMMRALATIARKRIPWNTEIPEAIYLAMLLDKDRNPTAVAWEPFRPGLHWQDGLPVDENSLVDRLVKAVEGRIMSQETAIRFMHPDWDDEAVADEIGRIDAGQATLRQVLAPAADTNGPDGPQLLRRAREIQAANPGMSEQDALDQAAAEAQKYGQGAA